MVVAPGTATHSATIAIDAVLPRDRQVLPRGGVMSFLAALQDRLESDGVRAAGVRRGARAGGAGGDRRQRESRCWWVDPRQQDQGLLGELGRLAQQAREECGDGLAEPSLESSMKHGPGHGIAC